ncbi:MAG: DUF488 domain-containing protein [Acidimicrobiaceae bacterium]|nr:DUF488 domain-containing protein [Acidimicrobiaceae bacterium]
MELFTVGHGARSQHELSGILHEAGVETVVDVRRYPGSRRHPQFARDALEFWLPEDGLAYRWEPALGGFRTVAPGSPDTALRHRSFQAYAGHMRTDEFRRAVDMLLDDARTRQCAVMCSESLWWRCHRRLIADYVTLVDGTEVRHVMPNGSLARHVTTSAARLDGRQLVYDNGQPQLVPS